jgi:hypothetical protein
MRCDALLQGPRRARMLWPGAQNIVYTCTNNAHAHVVHVVVHGVCRCRGSGRGTVCVARFGMQRPPRAEKNTRSKCAKRAYLQPGRPRDRLSARPPAETADPRQLMLDGSRTLVIDDEEWTIESLLGSGGFASVYQATGESGRSAAIKMVDVAKHPAPAKLRTEADSLMRAQTHSNVIRLLIEERRGPHHFFVMESWGRDHCELGLEQHGLSEASVQHIMVQVLRALSWLHEMRICHGCA